VFTVIGTYEPQVVQLFPNTSCSCPAKSNCYHVLAASMAFRMHCEEPKKPFNLTQLQRNECKHLDKTSGRKHSRIDDVDMVPAGDDDGCTVAGFVSTIALHVTQLQFLPSLLLTVKMMDCVTFHCQQSTKTYSMPVTRKSLLLGWPAVSRSSIGWAAINVDTGTTPAALE
jgi:hypothetical protein